MPLGGSCRKSGQAFVVTVDGLDLESVDSQMQRMAPCAAGHIERAAFWQPVQLLGDEARRDRVDCLRMMRGAGPIQLDSYGTYLLRHGRSQLTHPQPCTSHGKLKEQHREHFFGEGF